jgi:hypothetical protein
VPKLSARNVTLPDSSTAPMPTAARLQPSFEPFDAAVMRETSRRDGSVGLKLKIPPVT